MTSSTRIGSVPPEVRPLIEAKRSPLVVEAARIRLADSVAKTVRNGGRILRASDFDGTMGRFRSEPMDSRVDPVVAQMHRGYMRLPNETTVVITGGDAERSGHVLAASNLRVDAYCVYGAQKLTWSDGRPLIQFHPRSSEIAPILSEVTKEVSRLLRQRFDMRTWDQVFFDNSADAVREGGVRLEQKGTVFAFHPKGIELRPDLSKAVEEVVAEALANVKQQIGNRKMEIERDESTRSRSEILLLTEALSALEIHDNNGNQELVWNLGLSKLTAFQEIEEKIRPSLITFEFDDKGDRTALDYLADARGRGIETFTSLIYNVPEPSEGRQGTPSDLIPRADVVFLSPEEMGYFHEDALILAAERNPDLAVLQEAIQVYPQMAMHLSM